MASPQFDAPAEQDQSLIEAREPLSVLIPVLEFGRGGGYRVLSKLADEWIERGAKVAFLAPAGSGLPYYPTKASIYWIGTRESDSEYSARDHRWIRAYRQARKFWRLLRDLSRGIDSVPGSWDVVLANHSLTAWPVALCRRQATKIYYIQGYEPEFYELKTGFRNTVLKWISLISYVLPLQRIVNAPVYLRYRRCRADRWIPPGIDLELFYPAKIVDRPQAPWTHGGLVVGCIGRPEREKGTREAIEAYREFVKAEPGLHTLRLANFGVPHQWIGDIPGLESVFPSSDEELAAYYRSLDVVLALCTIQRGAHHYPVLESMASGVGVITTGYAPATKKNAWIVGDRPEHAAAALSEFGRYSKQTAQRIDLAIETAAAYRWSKVADDFLNAFDDLRARRPT